MKTSLQLEEQVRELLEHSKWRGNGPHGHTITAVMKRVRLLRKRAMAAEGTGLRRVIRVVKKAS